MLFLNVFEGSLYLDACHRLESIQKSFAEVHCYSKQFCLYLSFFIVRRMKYVVRI